MKVSVSFLKSKYVYKDTIEKIGTTDADYIHVDIMDGHFVKNKTFSFSEVLRLLGSSNKKLDVHLMVHNPEKYVDGYAMLNIEYLTVHYEAVRDNPMNIINQLKALGIKCGFAIKPTTEVEKLKEYLPLLDQILVMTVEPGLGGQDIIPVTIDKIDELNVLRSLNNYNYVISADGGINDTNIWLLKEKGLDMAVSGSFICMSDDYQSQIDKLR